MRIFLALSGSLWCLAGTALAQEPEGLSPEGREPDCPTAVAEAESSPGPPAGGPGIGAPQAGAAALIIIPPAPEPPQGAGAAAADASESRSPALPSGRAVAALSEDTCRSTLEAHGVLFQPVAEQEADGVSMPIRLTGALGGVQVANRGGSQTHEILDCRLAVAILGWAPALRRAGVAGLLHYSIYRPGARVSGTRRRSGHASALAIDLAVFVMDDGTEHEVLTAWESRERGAAPCDGVFDESVMSARLRGLVCEVARQQLFQVVLTPHYDTAHSNHVHLELRPGVSWQYVR